MGEVSEFAGWDDSTWLHDHYTELEEYVGKWIGVLDRRVVAAGESVAEVSQQLRAQGMSDVLVVKVPTRSEREAYFIG